MRRLFIRTAAVTLCVTLGFGLAAAPCLAAETAKAQPTLTQLSTANRKILAKAAPRQQQNQPAAPTTSSSFFKSTKGKVTLALMGAGVGFTLWSIHHDREPVKSPVR